MGHTPGPWNVSKNADRSWIGVECGDSAAEICTVCTENIEVRNWWQRAEADANLIAAAPDFLAVCKAVVEEDGFRGSALMRKRIDAMKSAIAKAEGRSV